MSTPRTHLSLDGTWTRAFDAKRVGLEQQWFEKAPADTREIELPTMQSQGLARQGGVGWYFKTFEFDAAWQEQFASLSIGALNYPATIWLNGIRLGTHPGGGVPASFPVSAHLKPGSNVVTIRVSLFEADEEVVGEFSAYYPLDGLADIALDILPKAHIGAVYIQPDIRRKRLRVLVEAASDRSVHLQIEGTSCRAEGEPGELTIEFPEFTCWSLETPVVYTLRIDLIGDDGTLDSQSIAFGMREFTVKDERFYFNNRPFFLKCVRYAPEYPQNLKADKLALLLKREMKLLVDGGFNTLRVCGGPAPQALLDLADTLGILVLAEVSTAERCGENVDWEGAVEAHVLRDRNRISLVAWCGVHVLDENAAPSARVADSCAAEIRELDPSRLILCDAQPDGGMRKRPATLLRPYRENGEPYESFETSIIPPVSQLAKDYLRLAGDPLRLNFQGQMSAGGAVDWADGAAASLEAQKEFDRIFLERQLDRCFGGMENFFAASQQLQADGIRAQLDAIRSNIKMMGYGVESLCDGPSTSPFGLADVKRHAKPVLKSLKQVQHGVRPVVQIYKTNLVPREEVNVTILLINEARIEGRGELSLQVVGPTNQVLWKKKRLVKIPRHGRELWSGEIAASGSPGPHKFVVRLMQDNRVVGENFVDLHVVPSHDTEPVEINVLGSQSKWRSPCGRLAKLHNFLAPIHIVPPLANTIRAYPANDLIQVLAQVNEGAVAIIFSPPEDWNDLTEYVGAGLKISSCRIDKGRRVNHHYAKLHPVFDGLPSRDLMGQPYHNILSLQAFESESDEEMSGVHSVWRDNDSASGSNGLRHWWGNNITVKRLGAGRVVFTHLRILEHLGADPVADRVFVNLLQHFVRRSIPATEVVAADQKAVEWLLRERANGVRKWMVIGSFPNWGGEVGHDTAYPPEANIDFDATYPGWYRALRWKAWNSRLANRHTLDFTEALDGDVGTGAPSPYGTVYAYAEFSCDRRQDVAFNLKGTPTVKLWLNGALIHATDMEERGSDSYDTVVSPVKQGKNTLLIKCSKGLGDFKLSVEVEGAGTAPLIMNWWK